MIDLNDAMTRTILKVYAAAVITVITVLLFGVSE
jgi:hypothetical protein